MGLKCDTIPQPSEPTRLGPKVCHSFFESLPPDLELPELLGLLGHQVDWIVSKVCKLHTYLFICVQVQAII